MTGSEVSFCFSFRVRRPLTYFILKMAVSQEQKPWGNRGDTLEIPVCQPDPPSLKLYPGNTSYTLPYT